ncbi:BolA family transcriptional regulator [Bradymonadaceae bacterium TMQ3]|uniref:BolA family transcriptional regulator n=1 Tax=Lujinxingia sediminis TaxID=2480984 RepID=A0ABY0CUI1_9DELT|nr:BolA family transcriptional regulator [Lujinxingia sediminis]RDV38650.1 BolA family transcriptional regulator [Bradymonadaceae bacterium TMQ3]RVU44799.1 BolA family transcriptional regulator [Lujinxingia sediminis]TXC76578.1 BolA family transcriptional regulator [Bradymonadales bacterium TMQ1]
MIEASIIVERIQAALPGANVQVQDLTGTMDHYKAVVIAEQFAGKTLVARHRAIYQALAEEMKGPIHALTLDVFTPEEWEAQG